MTDTDFELAIRGALNDRHKWDELIATPAGLDAADAWLRDALVGVQADQAQRKAQWDADRAARITTRQDWEDYENWRSRALGFKRLVERRLMEVKRLQKSANVSNADQARIYKHALLRLASRVQNGGDANALLDEIRLPFGTGEVTLREASTYWEDRS